MDLLVRLWRDFWRNPWQARFMVPLVAINAAGSVYGYCWYRQQLAETPLYFWPFVPDSPLSTSLFALALAFRLAGAGGLLFPAVAFAVCIKYGIWAIALITHYWLGGGPAGLTEAVLWLSHLGMAVEGAAFLKPLRLNYGAILAAGAWMFFNDLMDYGAGLHPYLFAEGQAGLAVLSAVGLSVLITAFLLLAWRRNELRQPSGL
ncbi:MAG: DUF1405 domain-containing protein [Pelotomaculum sp.]|uniref:Hypothetical membrane protein n=1 Tax=Pelotomaculum thermopropionicum (strain DSM 13744 / JCM 10971 / SI) TaxID=370438 RepID=A5CYP1_PELTS|nr:DUF1405 domain-containing protein [Pelotomaculum sp.]BAF60906.1 hypothetical membrane protein [Pelotomaculum thermopropionicum SI]